ncbi:MAG: diguanylate cyclase [Armatimonadota bacterium]|nr:diguanylate cyclase [Armatimonadota bacterium]MDW8155740.1 diguanylate cyclase [Armatimonadota bacterium]
MDGNATAVLHTGVGDRIVRNWITAVEGTASRARVALQARGRALLEGTEAVLQGNPDGLVDRLRRDPQWGLSAIQSLAEELRQLLLFRAAAMEGIPDLTEAQKVALHAAFDRAAVELAKWFEALAKAAGDARLEAERIRDAATGLFNRRYLEISVPVEVQRSLRYGHPLCLLAARLDNYEELLGRWGQGVAEEAVREAAAALQRVTRAVDTKFYVEPDQFYVLMPEANPEYAFLIAERVREAVQASAPHGATVSVGAACCPIHAQDARTLQARAEEALATAKRLGGNTSVVYEPA